MHVEQLLFVVVWPQIRKKYYTNRPSVTKGGNLVITASPYTSRPCYGNSRPICIEIFSDVFFPICF